MTGSQGIIVGLFLCTSLQFSGISLMQYQLQGHVSYHLICMVCLARNRPNSHRGMVTSTRALWMRRLLARLYRMGANPPSTGSYLGAWLLRQSISSRLTQQVAYSCNEHPGGGLASKTSKAVNYRFNCDGGIEKRGYMGLTVVCRPHPWNQTHGSN